MIGNLNSIFKQKIKLGGGAPVYDADAQAYFTANTAITSTADKNAINTFYLGLKSDGIYTKINAMYLPLWSSASANKWNLKNPVDTNGAYRLTFSTGWTHSSSGMTPNATSAFADSFLTTSVTGLNSGHLSYYSRTNSTGNYSEMGALQNTPNSYTDLAINLFGTGAFIRYNNGGTPNGITNTNSTGFYINTRTASNSLKFFKNGSLFQSLTTISSSTSATRSIYIGALNNQGTAINFSNRQCSFASIGTGLTDTEATNFSNRVNTLLAYFGINIYPAVSDSDAQAYINANDAITSQSDASAINTFFTGLKSDGIYTKIKAMYLPIWGSASASKWNLKDPRDLDAAFRLTFATGFTFSSGGMLPNGTSAYANTFLIPSTAYAVDHNKHMSFYSRTNAATVGVSSSIGSSNSTSGYCRFTIRGSSNQRAMVYGGTNGTYADTETNSLGFYLGNRSSSTASQFYKNGLVIGNGNATNSTTSNIPQQLLICAAFDVSSILYYDNKQCAFASIGDSLTSTEVTNFNTRLNTLMTYFGINV